MNCKQGDLAIVVRGAALKNIGKIVKCVRQQGIRRVVSKTGEIVDLVWYTEPTLPAWNSNNPSTGTPDSYLMPLRGLPEDEDVPTNVDLPEEV